VKHARSEKLQKIKTLLRIRRNINNLEEKRTGHFYFEGINTVHSRINNSKTYVDMGNSRTENSESIDIIETGVIIKRIREYLEKISL
jgi:hypothetical protein